MKNDSFFSFVFCFANRIFFYYSWGKTMQIFFKLHWEIRSCQDSAHPNPQSVNLQHFHADFMCVKTRAKINEISCGNTIDLKVWFWVLYYNCYLRFCFFFFGLYNLGNLDFYNTNLLCLWKWFSSWHLHLHGGETEHLWHLKSMPINLPQPSTLVQNQDHPIQKQQERGEEQFSRNWY